MNLRFTTRPGTASLPVLLRALGGTRAAVRLGALLLLALAGPARADAIADLHHFVGQFQTARGAFVQTVSNGQKTTTSEGDFVFARPGKFRWTYHKPYEQVIIADGRELILFDQDLNQETIRPLTDAIGATPAALLFGESSLDKSFNLADRGTRDGMDWLAATPKTHDTTFAEIDVGFKDGELAAMVLKDALGQVTRLEFDHLERNVAVNADTFRFVPPAGADVLHQ